MRRKASLEIIGIGTDLIEVERIQSAWDRFGDRFLNRIFAPGEQAYALSRPHPAESLAARFAAKEAVMKALGTGRFGVSWREIEVTREPSGMVRLLVPEVPPAAPLSPVSTALVVAVEVGLGSWQSSILSSMHW